MQSYQLDYTPEMRMMWRDSYHQQVVLGTPSINNSTVDMLVDTIPHI